METCFCTCCALDPAADVAAPVLEASWQSTETTATAIAPATESESGLLVPTNPGFAPQPAQAPVDVAAIEGQLQQGIQNPNLSHFPTGVNAAQAQQILGVSMGTILGQMDAATMNAGLLTPPGTTASYSPTYGMQILESGETPDR